MFVFPIENFETKIQELSISPDMRIRVLTSEERKSLADRPGPIEVTYPRLPHHSLEVKAENMQPAMKKAYPIISALRLLKSKLVGVNVILFPEEFKGLAYRYPSSVEADMSSRRINKGTYELEKTEESDFLNLSNEISKMIEDRKLRLALERFNMSYSSGWLETALLDYLIALESLYLPGETEKKFRLCCYMVSILSSGSRESTEQIWNYIGKAYDLRSRIVHGSGTLPFRVKIGKGEDQTEVLVFEFVDRIEEYIRESIREFLRRGKKVEEVQADIKADVIRKIGTSVICKPRNRTKEKCRKSYQVE